MGRGFHKIILQRRYTRPGSHVKAFNFVIISAHQNRSEVAPHTCWLAVIQRQTTRDSSEEIEKRTLLAVGMWAGSHLGKPPLLLPVTQQLYSSVHTQEKWKGVHTKAWAGRLLTAVSMADQGCNQPKGHEPMSGWTKCDMSVQWNLFSNKKEWGSDSAEQVNEASHKYPLTVWCFLNEMSPTDKSPEAKSRLESVGGWGEKGEWLWWLQGCVCVCVCGVWVDLGWCLHISISKNHSMYS